MKKMLPPVLLVLSLLLMAASGASAETAAPAAAAGTCPDPVETAVGGPIAPGTCSADCGAYEDVTIQCSGTCTIVDQNCSSGVRGYVQCNGGTKHYCGECGEPIPTCPYGLCPVGISCNTHADCCATIGPFGYCLNGTCQC